MSVRINTNNFWLLGLIIVGISCQSNELDYNSHYLPFAQQFKKISGYNLLEPSETYILPNKLTEISGVTSLNDSVLACVQDEAGSIFLYGLAEGKILDRFKFAGNGDYEGIEIVDNQIYILKSSGKIYQFSIDDRTTNTINTPLRSQNNAEGLAYDYQTNQLLIVCKGKAGLNGEKLIGKAVYGYHLIAGFKSDPLFLITPDDLVTWNERQESPIKLSKRKKAFMLSGVAIHPQTKEIYLVATVGKLLIVLSPEGKIGHVVPLSPRVFRQPEGICFKPNGDLIISNEGQDGRSNIQVFKKTAVGLNEFISVND
jgi:uncharacterized protein YjiK